MKYKPANNIQDLQFFGEFGVVNPSISDEEQRKMGLSKGLIRFSVGLDKDIERTYNGIKKCLMEFKLI